MKKHRFLILSGILMLISAASYAALADADCYLIAYWQQNISANNTYGGTWFTTIKIVNLGAADTSITITFYDRNGTAIAGSATSPTVAIGRCISVDSVGQCGTTGVGSLAYGSCKITGMGTSGSGQANKYAVWGVVHNFSSNAGYALNILPYNSASATIYGGEY